MTFLNYLRDRVPILIGWLLLDALLVFMVWLTPGLTHFWDNLAYLFLLQLVLIFLLLALYYFRKKEWLAQFRQDTSLQQFVKKGQTHEERAIEHYVNQQVLEHRQTMQQVIDQQKDQKEYIDSWIHEIKVPLAAVDLILRSIEFDVPDEKYLLLQDEVQRIDEYVEQVLYYSRADEFVNDYLIQEYSLKAIIQPVIASQANYFIQKKLQLTVPENDARVLTDSKWIAFVFRQLLSNAIKYTPANGTITLTITEKNDGVLLQVADHGIGIPPEDLGRIFDKGFTGENGRSAEKHSTGLGLYLAKQLTEKLGVTLTAESEVGHGTTMKLFFPTLRYYHEKR